MTSVLSVASSSSSSASSIFPKPQAAPGVPQYKFACTLCSIPFARQDDLSDHYRKSLVHPQCDRCGVGARDAGTLADVSHIVVIQRMPYSIPHSIPALYTRQPSARSVQGYDCSKKLSMPIAPRKAMRRVLPVPMISVAVKTSIQ